MAQNNDRGDLTEAIITAKLLEKNWIVLRPYGQQRFDLVAIKDNNEFVRGQCKTARYRNSSMSFPIATKGRVHATLRPYTKDQIDVFWVYLPENGKVYEIPVAHAKNKYEHSLKLTTPIRDTRKDKQLCPAEDFEL